MITIGNEWDDYISGEFEKEYYITLREKLSEEYRTRTVYPAKENIFNALKFTPYSKVKVLLLGQDPYHGVGQAHGLAFSVQKGVAKPPSLLNIFQELSTDLGVVPPSHGCLTDWTTQGVMLLNTVLTVREGEANSHKNLGWTTFTDKIIETLNAREDPVIFLLWGRNAADKLPLITGSQHFVLSAAHPSPLSASRGFFGCRHFSKVNEILTRLGKEPVNWQIAE
ncbi:uracil-DNA glycosylase [Congzhengia minquanensis]|jgi:uracil-DNA glycosylase|uniref:Uracil-DNA glycosylase n=1 Tax=Congzhengia minquanensis TaxID=2763657 RepID=A0A926DLA2_9FIRM|nr:uracil-DNA glycosylase [Congzhengia minquanensis]MBC8540376.1 uracil-DNA glycosylase [Congzhengia minquanensis]